MRFILGLSWFTPMALEQAATSPLGTSLPALLAQNWFAWSDWPLPLQSCFTWLWALVPCCIPACFPLS